MLSKPNGTPEGYAIVGSPPLTSVSEALPHLCEYLCQDAWPDGTARDPSVIIIMAEGGTFKACLSVKETEQCLWTSAEDPRHLLDNLEAGLDRDRVDWRRRRGAGFPKKRA